jgi:hypothetical protein
MQNVLGLIRSLGFKELTFFLLLLMLANPYFSGNIIFESLLGLFFLVALLNLLSPDWYKSNLGWVPLGLIILSQSFFTGGKLIFPGKQWTLAVAEGFYILLCVFLIFKILPFVFRSRQMTLNCIFAAVIVYLLIALTFAMIYDVIFLLKPQSFKITHFICSENTLFRHEFLYFSLLTITTLGYGDIVATLPFAQMLSVLQAVVGTLYMAILIASLVGKYITDTAVVVPREKNEAGA